MDRALASGQSPGREPEIVGSNPTGPANNIERVQFFKHTVYTRSYAPALIEFVIGRWALAECYYNYS
jgi:hypothetical protein